jgi:hypothetical protein
LGHSSDLSWAKCKHRYREADWQRGRETHSLTRKERHRLACKGGRQIRRETDKETMGRRETGSLAKGGRQRRRETE